MATATFKMDDSQLQSVLAHLASGLNDWRDPLQKAEKITLQGVSKNFATGGAEIAGGWAARKKAYPWPILRKTGAMKGATARKSLSSNRLVVSNPTPYYKYHQMGTSKMAQRQVLGFSPKMEFDIAKAFARYIRNLIS